MYINIRAQQISSFYLAVTAITPGFILHQCMEDLSSHKQQGNHLLCLTSMERCCIATLWWSPLPKSSLFLGIALKPPKRSSSLPVGHAALQAWPHHCHWLLTKAVEMPCPHMPPNMWQQLLSELPTRSPLSVKMKPHIGKLGGLTNRLCSALLFWLPIVDKETLI